MGTERADGPAVDEHDPYERRPGYVTSADGRTDRMTTDMFAGVVVGFVLVLVFGFFQLVEWIAIGAAVVIGAAVWLVLRSRRRRADRRAGRLPDAVPRARDRAIAEANGGRRFFVAQNPVVVIVMGAIFIGVAVAPLLFGGVSVGRIVTGVIVVASGVVCIVQGIGTLRVRRRERAAS
ncbi:hypothetical protein JG551_002671 [Curtobacterium flaccumfaciens pv. flaccumfaciens]|uniref:hypothetical protein n=1 Tax=Curtobacterium flaccumfaciens TaxID=2035 RepID=UPI001BCAF73C|nr:hypothetical protein [Curtobacterium flaccumfaciens]QVG65269.1 hypothetical protein JG551_002671 [Curtobacterium flaccumfaciens pv. flaccumfaciens]